MGSSTLFLLAWVHSNASMSDIVDEQLSGRVIVSIALSLTAVGYLLTQVGSSKFDRRTVYSGILRCKWQLPSFGRACMFLPITWGWRVFFVFANGDLSLYTVDGLSLCLNTNFGEIDYSGCYGGSYQIDLLCFSGTYSASSALANFGGWSVLFALGTSVTCQSWTIIGVVKISDSVLSGVTGTSPSSG